MNVLEQLKRDEGCKRVAGGLRDYRDSKGLWTRGYGHLIVPQPAEPFLPAVISEAEAEKLLQEDILKHEAEMRKALPWIDTHPYPVYAAVLNLVFNMGVPRLRGFEGFLGALERRDYPLAAIELLDSKYYREDVGPRAVRLAKQIVQQRIQ